MILYQYKCGTHGIFEEMREVDERHSAPCPECGDDCKKIMSVSSDDTIFQPRWMNNIAPFPVFVKSREHLARICNEQGNYTNFPFTRNSSEIKSKTPKIIGRKEKQRIWRHRFHD